MEGLRAWAWLYLFFAIGATMMGGQSEAVYSALIIGTVLIVGDRVIKAVEASK